MVRKLYQASRLLRCSIYRVIERQHTETNLGQLLISSFLYYIHPSVMSIPSLFDAVDGNCHKKAIEITGSNIVKDITAIKVA